MEVCSVLTKNNATNLAAGEYFIMIDAIWKGAALVKDDYKKIKVTVNAPVDITLKLLSHAEGLSRL
jgi:hypothetical protein